MNRASKSWLIWIVLALVSLFFLSDNAVLMGLVIAALLGRFIMLWSLERLLFLLLLVSLPFSIDLHLFSGSKLSFPAEGLVLVLFFSFVFNLLQFPFQKWQLVKAKREYALLFGALFFIGSIAVTASFSSMPSVSFKFFAVNLLFMTVGMGYAFLLLIQQKIQLREILQAIIIGLSLLVIYVLVKTVLLGFGRAVAPALPKPFFNDHTHLAATLLLLAPLVFYLWKTEENPRTKKLYLVANVLFVLGLIVTFSRAAWLGGIIMLVFVFVWHYNVKKELVLAATMIGLIVLVFNRSAVESYFRINRNDSNRLESGLDEQIKSVTNVTSDVSNLERLNRWKCALRMGLEKPFFGYGPGTYQFQYIPFQRKNELTRISVKSPFYIKEGKGGTAHSEYLLSFSESGWPGLISWIVLIFSVIFSYALIIRRKPKYESRLLSRIVFVGLIGYFILAFFNNFLNAANFALYFWFTVALLLYLALRTKRNDPTF